MRESAHLGVVSALDHYRFENFLSKCLLEAIDSLRGQCITMMRAREAQCYLLARVCPALQCSAAPSDLRFNTDFRKMAKSSQTVNYGAIFCVCNR